VFAIHQLHGQDVTAARIGGQDQIDASHTRVSHPAGLRNDMEVLLRLPSRLTVRDGKGAKDRITLLPDKVREPLNRHLLCVKTLHEGELVSCWSGVA